jgi:hypothetical protein
MARLRLRTRLTLIAASALLVAGVVLAIWDSDSPFWELNTKIKMVRDRQPAFQIDPDQPYEITLHEMVFPSLTGQEYAIHHDGRVVTNRRRWAGPAGVGLFVAETATFTIPPEARAEILEAAAANRVMKLHRSYDYTDTFDGCSRGVVITQGGRVKSIGCRNYFPEAFERFRRRVETILSRYQENVKWQEVKWP